MGKYLEDKELDSVLENYFNERFHIFNDDKNIERINRKIKEALDTNKTNYKYFYITIKHGNNEMTSFSDIILFGSNEKLTIKDFKTNCYPKDKKICKKLTSASTSHTKFLKTDLDEKYRKYVILER